MPKSKEDKKPKEERKTSSSTPKTPAKASSRSKSGKPASAKKTREAEIKKKYNNAKSASAKRVSRRVKYVKTDEDKLENNSSVAPSSENDSEKNPHVTRPTLLEEIEITDRQWKVWQYYKAGCHYREISEILKSQGETVGVSIASISADIHHVLNLQREHMQLDVEDYVQLEYDILMDVHKTFYPQMKKIGQNVLGEDKTDAAKIIIMASKERSKLKNLYKLPEGGGSGTLEDELAKLLKIKKEQLPDTDG